MIKDRGINFKEILKQVLPNKVIKALRGSGDFDKEALLNNFYLSLRSQGFNANVIYDVGANKGLWTSKCLEFFPYSNYYLFEPQINLANEIKSKYSNNNNIQVFPFGVGNKNEELLFTIADRDDSCSFTIEESKAKELGFKQIKSKIICLDSFISENNLKNPDLLKIDAEGFDLEVLEGAVSTIQNHVEVILIEVGIMNMHIKNDALTVMNKMNDLGFKLFEITDLNRPFNNTLWLSEFVFIRRKGKLDIDYSQL